MKSVHQLSPLVETDWLEGHLDKPDIRVVECTVLSLSVAGEASAVTGYDAWQHGHIPGSCFVDLADDLSDAQAEFPFMMPSAEQFSRIVSQHGIGHDHRIILYDRAGTVWAARLWWMLRAVGCDNIAILHGGWEKWSEERRMISQNAPSYPQAQFIARERPECFASQHDVLHSVKQHSACLIDTLIPEQHQRIHIPGSINIPYFELFDGETGIFLERTILQQVFERHHALGSRPIITYCQSGITACATACILTFLGWNAVSVYDGSMSEWTSDTALPVEKGGQ